MLNAIIKNRFLLLVLLIFILCFSVVLYIGLNKIFRKEVALTHSIANTELLSASSTVEFFFSDIRSKLDYLKTDVAIQRYINSNLSSGPEKRAVFALLEGVAAHSGNILQAYIHDSQGKAIMHIDGKTPDTLTPKNHNHLPEQLVSNKQFSPGTIRFFAFAPRQGKEPMLAASMPLVDDQGVSRGFLTLTVNLGLLFKMIPDDISIQTDNGVQLSFRQGRPVEEPSTLPFSKVPEKGVQSHRISDTQTLHYTSVRLTANQILCIVKKHRHAPLSGLLKQLVRLAGVIVLVFLGFIVAIAYVMITRMQEKIKADRTMIHALIALTDWRDPETGAHLNRTRQYSAALAKQIRATGYTSKVTKKFIQNIFEAAPLHDIGKVGIKDAILLKPGKFTPDEFKQMQRHVTIGKLIIADLVKRLPGSQSVLKMALNICEFHHERFDGSGYIAGLKGKEIPLEARIFAVADVYDALRSERPYKKALDHTTVAGMIRAESGKHFDPVIVQAFCKIESVFRDISRQKGKP